MRFRVFLLTLILLPSLAAAQRSWIVDARNGTGSDFSTLADAFRAAKAGDTVLVRKGTYFGGTISKGIALLAEAGTFLSGTSRTLLTVANLPRGEVFRMKGFVLLGFRSGMRGVEIRNCRGRVHVEDLTIRPFAVGVFDGPGVTVSNCTAVTLSDCDIQAGPAVLSTSSDVNISRSILVGGPAALLSRPASAGLRAHDSHICLTTTNVRGGFSGIPTLLAAPAVWLERGSATIAGQGNTLTAGASAAPSVDMTALWANSCTVRLSPDMRLRPFGKALPFWLAGTGTVTRPHIPAIAATGAAPGAKLVTTSFARAGSTIVVLAGAPADPTRLVIGRLAMDLATAQVLHVARIGASRQTQSSTTIPAAAALRGLPVAIHAVEISAQPILLSPASVVVLH